MRALILVAGAALAVSACSSNEAADNTMNVDNLAVDNLVVNDTTAIDATNMDMNMDAMMSMNAADAANGAADAANNALPMLLTPRPTTRCGPTALLGSADELRGCRFAGGLFACVRAVRSPCASAATAASVAGPSPA